MSMPFTVIQGTIVHFVTISIFNFMARVQSVDDKAVSVFVSDANDHHSEWLELISPIDRHESDALDFCNLSACEQLVSRSIYIAGNRLDLMMTGVPDILDVFGGTPIVTSDHCWSVACFVLINLCRSTMSEVLFI